MFIPTLVIGLVFLQAAYKSQKKAQESITHTGAQTGVLLAAIYVFAGLLFVYLAVTQIVG